jgi:hypothetical protein
MAVHGDILEVTYNHPTLGSGVFYPKANEGNKFDPGGFRNNDDASLEVVQLCIKKTVLLVHLKSWLKMML